MIRNDPVSMSNPYRPTKAPSKDADGVIVSEDPEQESLPVAARWYRPHGVYVLADARSRLVRGPDGQVVAFGGRNMRERAMAAAEAWNERRASRELGEDRHGGVEPGTERM